MRQQVISEKKQKMLDEFNASPIKAGEIITLPMNKVSMYEGRNKPVRCVIIEVDGDNLTVKAEEYTHQNATYTVTKKDIISRNLLNIGPDPFDYSNDDVRTVNYAMESILFGLDVFKERIHGVGKFDIEGTPVTECNWNPFVFDAEGKKKYYQRGFVWTLQDNQLLVDSIYAGISCGRILVRNRSFKELRKMYADGERSLSFKEIVDGKQRLNAIRGFMMGEFTDSYGNYWGDLSFKAQHHFTDHQLFGYAEMPENTPDEAVLHQFLKLNFTGVPQSQEHLDFIKDLYLGFKK